MLESTLDVDPAPRAVRFTLIVRNVGPDPVTLRFRSALHADFAVQADDEEIWRWSDGRMFTHALEEETISPGGERTYAAEWTDPEPGPYSAIAALNAVEVEIEERGEFTVGGR